MTAKKSIENIVDAIEFYIKCTKCYDVATAQAWGEQDDWGEHLHQLGWRGTENNIYCPICAKTFKLK